MITLTLHELWARRRRVAGAGIAVVLGVAFLFATLAVGDTMRSGFDALYRQANAGIDVAVRSDRVIGVDDSRRRERLPSDLAATIERVDGVGAVIPVVDGTAQLVGADGDDLGGNGPPTSATNWIDDDAVNPYDLVDGRPPRAVAAGAPIEIVIDRGSARAGGLGVGDLTEIKAPQPEAAVVVGVASFGAEDSLASSTWVALDTATARRLLLADDAGALATSFVVTGDGTVGDGALRDRIASALPPGAEALTAAQLTADQIADLERDFMGFMRVVLVAFAGVAVLVAAFSIYNTFSIVVAQRTRESALLRAIGASRRQVLASSLAEATLIGVGASVLGVAVGWVVGVGLRSLLVLTGVDLPGTGLVVSGGAIAVSVMCGVTIAVVAGVAPSIRASRVAPLAALRDAAIDRGAVSWRRAIVGLVLVVAGSSAAVTATSSATDAFTRAGLGAAAVVIGVVVLGPFLSRPALFLLGLPLRLLPGESGRLGSRNAERNPTRTATTASALMVGSAVVVLFTVFGASVATSIRETVDRSFGGDLVLLQDSFSGAAIDPSLASTLESLDEVAVAAGMAFGPARVDGVDAEVTAVDPARFAAILDLDVAAGAVATLSVGDFAASVDEAGARGWAIGDRVPVEFADGSSTALELAATYREVDIAGDVIVRVDDVPRAAGFAGDVAVLVDLAPGVDLDAGAAAVDRVGGPAGAPDAQTRQEYLDSSVAMIQTILGVIYGLLALAVIIALMGIANTLSLSIHERRRELGLLRAVGQTRGELRSSIRWESMMIATVGTLGGVVVGVFLGWMLVRAIAAQEGLGTFTLPFGPLAVIVAVGAVAGTLAATRPARRAARVGIIDALGSS
jgi:putative ABC transport system permease protein